MSYTYLYGVEQVKDVISSLCEMWLAICGSRPVSQKMSMTPRPFFCQVILPWECEIEPLHLSFSPLQIGKISFPNGTVMRQVEIPCGHDVPGVSGTHSRASRRSPRRRSTDNVVPAQRVQRRQFVEHVARAIKESCRLVETHARRAHMAAETVKTELDSLAERDGYDAMVDVLDVCDDHARLAVLESRKAVDEAELIAARVCEGLSNILF